MLNESNLRPPPLKINLINIVAACFHSSAQFDGRARFLGDIFSGDIVIFIFIFLLLLLLPTLLLLGLGNDILVPQGIPSFNESNDGALTRAGRTNDCCDFPSFNPQVEIVQNLDVWSAGIGKGDLVEHNVVGRGHIGFFEMTLVGQGCVNDREELACCDTGLSYSQ